MAFKPPAVQPDFSSLIVSLTNSRLQTKDNALYQTVFQIIKRITTSRDLILADVKTINELVSAILAASYWTEEDETITLRNSRMVIAGSGITLDYSVLGQVTVSTVVTINGYWTPLTDGDADETDLIYANGEAIAVNVPNP